MSRTTEQPVRQSTARIDRLAAEIRQVVRGGRPPGLTAELVAGRLAPHLCTDDLLTPEQCEGDPGCYRQHLLHVEPDGSFSMVALVWLPGQRTAIHDHVSWCVTGVHLGVEDERRYRLIPADDMGPERLEATADVTNRPGDVAGFAPPGDIHRVRNGGSGKAISIHLYGANIALLGSSVRREYALPII